ncbi:putative Mitogen-activated protein kinase [Seiridium cardinale]
MSSSGIMKLPTENVSKVKVAATIISSLKKRRTPFPLQIGTDSHPNLYHGQIILNIKDDLRYLATGSGWREGVRAQVVPQSRDPDDEAGTVYGRPVRFFNQGNEPSFTTPNLLQRDPKWYVRSNQMGLGSLRDFRSAEPELSVDAHVHLPWNVEDLSTGRVTKVVKISGCNTCEEVMRVTLRNYFKTDPRSPLRSVRIAMARWRDGGLLARGKRHDTPL